MSSHHTPWQVLAMMVFAGSASHALAQRSGGEAGALSIECAQARVHVGAGARAPRNYAAPSESCGISVAQEPGRPCADPLCRVAVRSVHGLAPTLYLESAETASRSKVVLVWVGGCDAGPASMGGRQLTFERSSLNLDGYGDLEFGDRRAWVSATRSGDEVASSQCFQIKMPR